MIDFNGSIDCNVNWPGLINCDWLLDCNGSINYDGSINNDGSINYNGFIDCYCDWAWLIEIVIYHNQSTDYLVCGFDQEIE